MSTYQVNLHPSSASLFMNWRHLEMVKAAYVTPRSYQYNSFGKQIYAHGGEPEFVVAIHPNEHLTQNSLIPGNSDVIYWLEYENNQASTSILLLNLVEVEQKLYTDIAAGEYVYSLRFRTRPSTMEEIKILVSSALHVPGVPSRADCLEELIIDIDGELNQ